MAERYAWSRNSIENNIFELKRRNIARELYKDSELKCLVPTCAKRPKANEWCYYPSAGINQDCKIIGHRSCVDEFCKSVTTKTTPSLASSAKNLIQLAAAKQPKLGATEQSFYQGWFEGIKFVIERKLGERIDTADTDWLKGFHEGCTFAVTLDRQAN